MARYLLGLDDRRRDAQCRPVTPIVAVGVALIVGTACGGAPIATPARSDAPASPSPDMPLPSVAPSTSPAATVPASPRTPSIPPEPPEPTTGPRPGSPDWQVAGRLSTSGFFSGREDLVAFDAGYVVLHFRRDVYFSADGREWRRVELPWAVRQSSNGIPMDASVASIAASGSRVVVVGYADQEPCVRYEGDGAPPACQQRPVSWVSEDGINWEGSADGDVPIAAGIEYPTFDRVWSAGNGWDASLTENLIASDGAALVHSDDGLQWSPLPPLPTSPGADRPPGYARGLTAPTGHRVIWTFEFEGPPQLWRSDGGGWTAITELDPMVEIHGSLGPSVGGVPSWIIAGGSFAEDGRARLWSSTDGLEFREAVLPDAPSGMFIRAVTAWQGGYLALAGGRGSRSTIWASSDGADWTIVQTPESEWAQVYDLAVGPAGLAALQGVDADVDEGVMTTVLLAP